MELAGDGLTQPERVYLDHAATTPVAAEVVEVMRSLLADGWGNPSSPHARGRAARSVMDAARDQLAALLGCSPRELTFTSGGTESDNLALRGVVERWGAERGRHVVTSAIEHDAVLETVAALARRGDGEVTLVGCDAHGRVDPERIAAAVRPDTVLVSLMLVNNEVGTVQEVGAAAEMARRANPSVLVHTDAVQALGRLPLDVSRLGVDLMSLSAHKCYGPKGSGLLFARWGTHLAAQVEGGGQERGRRSGTENVAAAAGFAAAAALAVRELAVEQPRQALLRDRLESQLTKGAQVRVAAAGAERVAHISALLVDGAVAEPLVAALDQDGVEVSSGSACSSGAARPSHVLHALGADPATTALLRVSLGRGTTTAEVDRAATAIRRAVERAIGPAPASATAGAAT